MKEHFIIFTVKTKEKVFSWRTINLKPTLRFTPQRKANMGAVTRATTCSFTRICVPQLSLICGIFDPNIKSNCQPPVIWSTRSGIWPGGYNHWDMRPWRSGGGGWGDVHRNGDTMSPLVDVGYEYYADLQFSRFWAGVHRADQAKKELGKFGYYLIPT